MKRSHQILIASAICSIVIHMSTVSFLILSSETKTVPPVASEATIELLDLSSIRDTSITPPLAQKKSNTKTISKGDIFTGSFQVRNFNNHSSEPIQSTAEAFPDDPMQNVSASDSDHGYSGAVQYGNSMGLKFTLESLKYFELLHDRINSQLTYPDDFSRQRITGNVRIEAELGRDGRLLRFISSTSNDHLLQTYCFAILVQFLSQPLPESSWVQEPKTIVAFDFDFKTRVRHNISSESFQGFQKNRLAFSRENEIDPWLNEKIDEIFTRYIPPIIPIPGGFYIDLVMAYGYINNLIEGAPSERELRGVRISKLHELLRMSLKQVGVIPRPAATPDPNVF